MQVTQKAIAAKLGLSRQAVGFALADSPWARTARLPRATRELIVSTAEEMGYVPHQGARSLKSGKTKSVGIVTVSTPLFHVHRWEKALSRVLQEAGYRMILAGRDPYDLSVEKLGIKDLLSRRVDGLLILNRAYCDSAYYESLRVKGVPLVFFAPFSDTKNLPTVVVDSTQGMYEATKYLIQLGHREIACPVGGDALKIPHRLSGFHRALREHGLPLRREWLMDHVCECDSEATRSFTIKALRMNPRPTAIMYGDDEMALVGLHTILEMGLRVPEDVSVVGFNDLPVARLTWPELTTVRQPVDQVAREGVRLLMEQISTGTVSGPRQILLNSELIVRHSTGPVPRKRRIRAKPKRDRPMKPS